MIPAMMQDAAILQWICLSSQTVDRPCRQSSTERRDDDPSTSDRNWVSFGPLMGRVFEARLSTKGQNCAQPYTPCLTDSSSVGVCPSAFTATRSDVGEWPGRLTLGFVTPFLVLFVVANVMES